MNATVTNLRAQKRIRTTNRWIITGALSIVALHVILVAVFGFDMTSEVTMIGQRLADWFIDSWL